MCFEHFIVIIIKKEIIYMEPPGVFDALEGRRYPFFWKQNILDIEEKKKKAPVLIDDEMLRKSYRSGDLYPRKYIIFEDIMIKYEVKYY